MRSELQDAGQCYLDSKTSDYDPEENGSDFNWYCNQLEDDLYGHIECDLEVDEIRYEDFLWDMTEWVTEDGGYGFDEAMEENRWTKNEIDLILDRDIE